MKIKSYNQIDIYTVFFVILYVVIFTGAFISSCRFELLSSFLSIQPERFSSFCCRAAILAMNSLSFYLSGNVSFFLHF